MIEIRDDLRDYLEGLKTTTMAGWLNFVAGRGQVRSDGKGIVDKDYPLIRVLSAGMETPEVAYGIGRWEDATQAYKFVVQGLSNESLLDDRAERQLSSLVYPQPAHPERGLVAAMLTLATMGEEAAGRHWLWEVGDLSFINPVAAENDRWTLGVSVPVTARTAG